MAGSGGIEPPLGVLETPGLPLTYEPNTGRRGGRLLCHSTAALPPPDDYTGYPQKFPI